MKWFIYYTYPKAEQAIKKEFEKMYFEVFLPLHKVKKQWSDRVKLLEIPLFPNYIFIKSGENEIYKIIKHPRIIKYIAFEGRPATMKEEEINLIRNFTYNYNNIEIDHTIMVGDKVKFNSGPLKDYIGTLIEKNGSKRFGIKLCELNQTLSIEIDLKNIQIVRFMESEINDI